MLIQKYIKSPMNLGSRQSKGNAFKANEKGATAVEFALIAVPFIGMIAAIFETGLMFFASQNLQTAVTEGTRSILIGDAQADASLTSSSTFSRKYICPRLASALFNCSSLKVDVNVVSAFSSYSSSFSNDYANAGGSFCVGKKGDVVLVRALYPMPIFMKILALDASGNTTQVTSGLTNNPNTGVLDTRMLIGTAAFRNEPFMSAVVTPC